MHTLHNCYLFSAPLFTLATVETALKRVKKSKKMEKEEEQEADAEGEAQPEAEEQAQAEGEPHEQPELPPKKKILSRRRQALKLAKK